MKAKKLFTITLIVFLSLFITAGAFAAPRQEASEEDVLKIGVVFRTQSSAYLFQDAQYQSYYRSEIKLWRELAEKHNFELIEASGDVSGTGGVVAVDSLIAQGVDGIVFCFCEPSVISAGLPRAQEQGIPVVTAGIRATEQFDAPFVGFAGRSVGMQLGKATAELFEELYPDKTARILISNSETLELNQEEEAGFIEGFTQIAPSVEIVESVDDNGTIRGVMRTVNTALIDDQDVNVVFATSDIRAVGVINAIEQQIPERWDDVILTSIGGTERAFEEMIDPDSPWRAVAGYRLKDYAEQSWNFLDQMLRGELELDSDGEYFVEAEVFVDPSVSEAESFLRTHHRVMEFDY